MSRQTTSSSGQFHLLRGKHVDDRARFESLDGAGADLLYSGLVLWAPWAAIQIRRWTYKDVASQMFRDCKVYAQPAPGLVPFEMQHFSGLLAFVQWFKLQGYATPSDARTILGRILKHNLASGWLAYLGPLTPFITLPEYFSQRSKIDQAEATLPVAAIRQQPYILEPPQISNTRRLLGSVSVVLGYLCLATVLLTLLLRPLLIGFGDFTLTFVVLLLSFIAGAALLLVGSVCRSG